MKSVKISVVPGTVKEYAVENGSSVKDLAEMADLTLEGYEIRLASGRAANASTVLNDGDQVFLMKKIKGNA